MENKHCTVDRIALLKTLHEIPDGEEVLLRITGNSMLPLLFDQVSVVCLKRTKHYTAKKGDMVLFCRPDGAVVLHRVYRIQETGTLVINGDSQRWTERILPSQVLAVVTHFTRRKRNIQVSRMGYRLYVALWCSMRFFHPWGARVVYMWHRLPAKLGPKKKG